ncbi:MAG: hypothetical protein KC731_15790 [Myxococcales bacterium]|nr:hypothetical protein [Myxococcales bacterium]
MSPWVRWSCLAFVLVTSSAGCNLVDDTQSLGRFTFAMERTDSCGDTGILASGPALAFTIALRRGERGTLQWADSGEVHTLSQVAEDSYGVAIEMVVDMRQGLEGAENMPPCSVARRDEIVATLSRDDTGDVEEVEATLRFDFAATEDSQCSDLLSAEGIAGGLPCTIGYAGIGKPAE